LEAVDFDASRKTIFDAGLEDYRVLHFATHGFVSSRFPELSGLVLSLVDRNGDVQDGFLQAHEISGLKLRADLAVLSACRTALGQEIRGEGLVGLNRAFMMAGVPRVVASLWPVADRATAELMQRFYTALLKQHATTADALRQAQDSLRREPRWSAPFYWAGFTLQGEWH
jgi:CHAT domain-containing protein